MRIKTFDMVTGESVEGDLISLTMSGLAKIQLEDGQFVVRNLKRCDYDRDALKEWMDKKI
jgi:hypothetical protein